MPGFKFPRSHRLNQSREFNAVFQGNDFRISTPALLFLAKRNQRSFNRLGMVVGKKSLPGAVDRNRVKRMIREAFRQHLQREASLDVVVLVRPPAREPGGLQNVLKDGLGKLSDMAVEPTL